MFLLAIGGGLQPIFSANSSWDVSALPSGFVTSVAQDTITGTVYNDVNSNGMFDSEPGLAGWVVELHADSLSGAIDTSVTTDVNGNFSLYASPGLYYLTELVQSGWSETSPPAGYYTLTVDETTTVIGGNNFGNFQKGIIRVELTRDANGNRILNAQDTLALPTGAVSIFRSKKSGVLFRTDTLGDGVKAFTITDLDTGSYTVEQFSVATGWIETKGGTYSKVITASGSKDTARFMDFKLGTLRVELTEDVDGDGTIDLADTSALPSGTAAIFVTKLFTTVIHTDTISGGSTSFTITNLDTGTYTIEQTVKPSGWSETRGGIFTRSIASSGVTDTAEFMDFKPVTVSGMKFNDLNGNGVKDGGEPGLEGWTISLTGSGGGSTTTDINGNFTFSGVAGGSHVLSEVQQSGWIQTFPTTPSAYTFSVASRQNQTSMNFGNYRTTLIQGTVFYDRNKNGINDGSDGGLTNWNVVANCISPVVNETTTTQAGGTYQFENLPTGTYTISEIVKSDWQQTYPVSGSYTLTVISAFDTSGIDFGNSALLDSLKYRTFSSDSLIVKKAVKKNNISSTWCFDFVNTLGRSVDGLTVKFGTKVDSILDDDTFSASTTDSKGKTWKFSGATIADGETVRVCGVGGKRGMKANSWWWTNSDSIIKPKQKKILPTEITFLLPMPNAANFTADVFAEGFSPFNPTENPALVVGVERTDSTRTYGWVAMRKSADLYKSLLDKTGKHTDGPTGFEFLKTKSFTRLQRSLPPAKHNNKLFAEAAALKVNIAASGYEKTPAGFGELIYEMNNNVFSGMPITAIASRVDTLLTHWQGVSQAEYDTAYATLRRINRAFEGPIDTMSFGDGLALTGVTSVAQVSFLRPDPFTEPRIVPALHRNVEYVPEVFTLHQNYPNPFNPSTIISFDLPDQAYVSLKVFNMLGQEVASLLDNELLDDGLQEYEFVSNGLASGVYFYRVIARTTIFSEEEDEPATEQTIVKTKKMMLIR